MDSGSRGASSDSPLDKRLASLREEYARAGLEKEDLAAAPLAQLERWLDEALSAGVPEANAVTLATASIDGAPNGRIVLLKGIDDRGVALHGARASRARAEPRGAVVAARARTAGASSWNVERLSREVGGLLPLGCRGASSAPWPRARAPSPAAKSSTKNSPSSGRFGDGPVPLPPTTGVDTASSPATSRFWQGQPNRLHDRLRYGP